MKTSHPDKVFYPGEGLTKGDVVEYYRAVADVMLPHLRGRPDRLGEQAWTLI